MIRYYLRVEALSPVSITSHQTQVGQPNATLDYVPGTTLRGALAWRYLRQPGASNADQPFQTLFDQGGLWCGPLAPIEDDPPAGLALPLPLSARTCKRHEGFRSEPQVDRRGHGALDSLIAAIEETALAQPRPEGEAAPAGLRGLKAVAECNWPECPAPLERFDGRYEFGEVKGRRWARRVVQRQTLMTHTALLDDLQVAKPGALFSRQALERGQQLAGLLMVDEVAEADLLDLLQIGADLSVGAGRTTGLGRLRVVELSKEYDPLATLLGPLKTRYEAFEQLLPPSLADGRAFMPLTLLTDTILLDPWLRPAGNLSPDTLRWYARLADQAGAGPAPVWPATTILFLTVAQTHRIAAWNTAGSARPRSDDLAFAAGSVFVLSTSEQDEDALLAAGAWLEANGLGERREEGFGQLVVAHPFHVEVSPL